MKKLLILFLLSMCLTAYADGKRKDGFSGFLDIGALGVSSNDSLMVSGNNEDIKTLSDSPDRYGQGHIMAIFNVEYKNGDTVWHVGSPLENIRPELAAGVTKNFGKSSFDVSLVVNPLEQVWKDPYVSRREKTNDLAYGVKLRYEGIAGTGHFAELRVIRHDIGDDDIGKRYSSMKRDGYMGEFTLGYDIGMEKGKVSPFVKLGHDRRDGDAESYKSGGAGVLYVRQMGSGTLISALFADYEGYDEKNPIFGKTRRDATSGAFVNYKWQNPFGLKDKHIMFIAGAFDRESNIDFYDAVTYIGGVTFGFDF